MGVIIRQGFKAALSNYIGMGLGFLSLFILFPLFYEPKELGAIRLFLELGVVLSAFALIGTHYSINRFFPYFRTQDQKHHGFFFWVLVFPLVGYLLLTIVLLCFGDTILHFISPDMQFMEYFPMLLVLVLISLFQIITEVTCANHGRIAVPNFMKEIALRILIIIPAFLFYRKLISFDLSIWLIVIAYFIALVGNIIFLSKLTKISLKPDFEFLRKNPELKYEALKFTAFLFFAGIVALVIPKLDFFLISSIRKDLADVAVYSIGFYLATFIEVPKRTILQVATPIISNHLKNENYTELESLNKKNGTNQLLISGALFFFIWLNIDNLYEIMPKGEYYSKGKWVVFFIGLSKLIDAVGCGNSPIIANSKFYHWAFLVIVVAALSGIGFNYMLIPAFGINGGAISTVCIMLIINFCNFMIVQTKIKINPFHRNQLKILGILLIFMTTTLVGKWIPNPYFDSILKSIILGCSLIFSIYRLKVSEDFNQLLKSKIPFIK
jgi:O-antigen/teichoic acid export membrane protein